MEIFSADPQLGPIRRGAGRATAVLVVLVSQLLAGCAWLGPAADKVPGVAPDVTAALTQLLAQRAAAVREHQERRFVRTVVPGRLRATQRVWFKNLAQLPLARFRQTFEGPLTETATGYRAVVRTTTQLRGFDAVPIATFSSMTFTASSRGWQVSENRLTNSSQLAVQHPWDQQAVRVLQRPSVLLITDPASTADDQRLLAAVEAVLAELHRTVPWRWPSKVVVEAPATTEPLLRWGKLPGGAVDRVDGLTYRVRGGRDGRQFAASRLVLNPRVGTMSNTALYRLLRHELTHVALGERNDRIPMWLSEGLAEYLASQSLPRSERTIAAQARKDASSRVLELPHDAQFLEQASATQYALAWHACEVVARLRGEAGLWRLVDSIATRGRTDAASVLVDDVGLDQHDLAAQAQALIRSRYG